MTMPPLRRALARRLAADRDGTSVIEFAICLPMLLLFGLMGAEVTNYVITRMRISQIALHLADNAARIGTGTQLQQKTISEVDINDLLTGAGLQAGELDLYGRGRVMISSVENDPNNTGKYRIRWQRCRGSKSYNSPYDAPLTNRTGFGPGVAARQVIAPPDGASMWIEVAYDYKPIVRTSYAPTIQMVENASMMVRDRRALDAGTNGVVQGAGVTASGC